MKFQILRGIAAALPILGEGELAYCLDTGQLWIGNGQQNMLIGDPLVLERLKLVNEQLVEANRQIVNQIEDIKEKLDEIGSGGGGGGSIDPPQPGGKVNAATLQGRTPGEFVYLGAGQLSPVPIRTAVAPIPLDTTGIDADTLGGRKVDEFVFVGDIDTN